MAASEVRRLKLWQNRVETEVEIAGRGPPLIYLHGPWGLRANLPRAKGCGTDRTPRPGLGGEDLGGDSCRHAQSGGDSHGAAG